jgi:Ca-activated chloride channel family protein
MTKTSVLLLFVLSICTLVGCLDKKPETEDRTSENEVVKASPEPARQKPRTIKTRDLPVEEGDLMDEPYQRVDIVMELAPASEVMALVATGDGHYSPPDVLASRTVHNRIDPSGFKDVLNEPLSTFSIDVDTAGYANIRMYLEDEELPPVDAVRIEEMLNYFTFNYPQPDRKPFAIHHEVMPCPWNTENHLVLVGLKGREIKPAKLPPSNLVFLIDVSGSMDSPRKLGLLKKGFEKLVAQLRPQDRVSMVTYAGHDSVILEGVSGSQKRQLRGAIQELTAGGGTNGASGILSAYEIAHRNLIPDGNNRVILATDGDFNIGMSSESELLRLIEDERGKGVFLSVLGFGGYGGAYMDGKMEQLANHGDGNFNFIDSESEAEKVLVHDMTGTLFTIAKDVKIQVEFNPAQVASYRLIGYENRALENEDFEDDRKDAGELGAGHTVTALYEVTLTDKVGVLPEKLLKYQERVIVDAQDEWMTVSLRYKLPDEDTSQLITSVIDRSFLQRPADHLAFAAIVAEFGLRLRRDPIAKPREYAELARAVQPYLGSDKMIDGLHTLMISAGKAEAGLLGYQDE